jgi:hypothetical protein
MARKFLLGAIHYVLLTTLLVVAAPAAAVSQISSCGPRADVVDWLTQNYDERPVAFGLIDNSQLLEIHVSETGSWTAIISDVNGRSCVVSAGQSWTPIDRLDDGEAAEIANTN